MLLMELSCQRHGGIALDGKANKFLIFQFVNQFKLMKYFPSDTGFVWKQGLSTVYP